MYNDFFRDIDENQEFGELISPEELYELETFDLPEVCPYRQFVPTFSAYRFPAPMQPMPGGPKGHGAPSGPPPSFVPQKSQSHGQPQFGVKAIDPGAIRPCTFRFVYIWLDNGRSFWAFLTFVGRRSVAGFRWNGRRWVYFGIDLRRIESFYCH